MDGGQTLNWLVTSACSLPVMRASRRTSLSIWQMVRPRKEVLPAEEAPRAATILVALWGCIMKLEEAHSLNSPWITIRCLLTLSMELHQIRQILSFRNNLRPRQARGSNRIQHPNSSHLLWLPLSPRRVSNSVMKIKNRLNCSSRRGLNKSSYESNNRKRKNKSTKLLNKHSKS